ncbi:ANTAR domain-containing protein [Streptomyces sp. B1866]|uniref:ANTAR domain-containing response regulator n=1 Tax=Streptomyces sp. B1866 TaxID=3075431 RepID=UPI00288F143D|nr:ANTAR domain-containing protein [Streptomyces sp. B1866]MDT3397921.1 ANTAR domain-containing protein [Streptomyces sp. B1866]
MPESTLGTLGTTLRRPADATSLARDLADLAERAAWCTPGSCGATATALIGPDAGLDPDADPDGEQPVAATHPDLSALVSAQLESGEGPIPAALGTGRPAGADDLLYDQRWPRYRATALGVGIRSTATLPFVREGLAVTVTVYGLRPAPLERAAQGATGMLGDLATECLARHRRYRAVLAEVDQLDAALRSRPVVDQACGIVMYVLHCDAEGAFDLLRQVSQRANRKLVEVAEKVVSTRGHGLEREFVRLGRAAGDAPPSPPRQRAAGPGPAREVLERVPG